MIGKALAKVFGTSNERAVKRIRPLVEQINALEPQMQQLTDEQLRAKTAEFRARVKERVKEAEDSIARVTEEIKTSVDPQLRTELENLGKRRLEARNQALDEIMPEAFAVAREAGRRVLNMRHFDVQLIGGVVLHQGIISEMKTGEGKTLVATLPVYLNALGGDGVHVVTVNDYLAKRDSEWMGKLYRFLGMSVGVIVHELDDDERREAYAADVTYGTNNEFGFDYLRDNMKFDLNECVQRGHNFAIVDEVDSILIDEARTPLIISGQSDESTDKYDKANRVVPHLVKGEEIEKPPGEPKEYTGDYVIDEKHKNTLITDQGWEKVERLLGIENIADPENWAMKHHVETAVKAHAMYRRDVEYVVKDGEVIIVDEFTGRLMPGRRWSDGLHQAIEAKENVKIERESQTLATITFQNYFRMYKKLAGMTGTAETEAAEFDKIYKLLVVVIPTNRQLLRKENPDIVFRTEKEKYYAVADEIQKISAEGRPILVGTTSIEKSERLSDLLKKKNVKHVVLNAKYHEREAEIVAQAGRMNAVTIATNMAGRGTDILLGGNAEFMARQETVKKGIAQQLRTAGGEVVLQQDTSENIVFYYNGIEYQCPADKWNEIYSKYKKDTDAEHEQVVSVSGLHILGTERHEARRIDNQLRGRAGRQGDPGSSRFYLSLEDDLMRIFAKQWVSNLLQRLGMEEGVPIESKLISRRIEAAQKAVEAQNFESRKHVLEYDDVMNKQRVAVYGLRKELLSGIDQKELILDDYVASMVADALDRFAPRNVHGDQWDVEGLNKYLVEQFGLDMEKQGIDANQLNRQELGDAIFEKLRELYEGKEKQIGPDAMRYHERMIMLSVLDTQWKDHLLSMDHLKEGIGLRGYGQHDPLVEYKRESFDMFENMMRRSQEDTVRYLFHMQIVEAAQAQPAATGADGDQQMALPPPRKRASTS
ncbi:MAG TPA: preprotein translocase subunit SecA, partial [Candidatus Sulfotelmatobacter sp.]|nr:preprotein translocase subunit SecA [Candidatus Sulfotelmatobacter sp.]